MTRRRVLAAAGALVVVAAAAGAWVGASLLGSGPAQGSRPTVAVGTAVVHRQDLAVTDLVNGTLGYRPSAPLVNRLAGTYTALPAEGSVVGRGQALYQVDSSPVVLMYGRQPAWRALAPGIPDGPDVAELEANLAALGYARGLFGTPDAHFNWATKAAVGRWQRAIGLAQTGTVELGRVVFLPAAVRVGTHQAAVGAIASPDAAPYTATSSTRVVTVALDADRQGETRPGAKVAIDLPDRRTTPGTVAEVGRVAIARAVVGQPSIVLADEPTGNLDSSSGAAIVRLLRQLNDDGVTIAVVTHDRDLAAALPRRVELLDGRIRHDSAPVA